MAEKQGIKCDDEVKNNIASIIMMICGAGEMVGPIFTSGLTNIFGIELSLLIIGGLIGLYGIAFVFLSGLAGSSEEVVKNEDLSKELLAVDS